ncbi:hypothetical protein [Chlorogloea sp. CCALA 695]|uniref:hypothetical protein n=1 Tax=Chlorogloea sp. CCALA 695 TaxID=2107693 RepID=UPI000D058F06|nr:hypothetical protein [Chlorogloea sp. CCALA 695]PSB25166.1 hypothetical protein C7B70_25065 [Chlorogloea sp. CCALA 695]
MQRPDFHSFLQDWCATFELAKLKNGIRDVFEISSEELQHQITSLDTFGEQAALIERSLAMSIE